MQTTLRLFRSTAGPLVQEGEQFRVIEGIGWDELIGREDALAWLQSRLSTMRVVQKPADLLAPVGAQEVWAAGVTYWRSRAARMEESKDAGGGDFYDRVYSADRPELFFKCSGPRVVGSGKPVRIRRDSRWNVPEPELTLLIASSGKITGYTIGNDMSSRDIEGENPLYLPQAKVYDGSCSIGPCILLSNSPLSPDTVISIFIGRGGREVFGGSTTISQIKRELPSLAEFLFRENSHPQGCFLLTGTGVIPPDSFTLEHGDEVVITIEPIGTLVNVVA